MGIGLRNDVRSTGRRMRDGCGHCVASRDDVGDLDPAPRGTVRACNLLPKQDGWYGFRSSPVYTQNCVLVGISRNDHHRVDRIHGFVCYPVRMIHDARH